MGGFPDRYTYLSLLSAFFVGSFQHVQYLYNGLGGSTGRQDDTCLGRHSLPLFLSTNTVLSYTPRLESLSIVRDVSENTTSLVFYVMILRQRSRSTLS